MVEIVASEMKGDGYGLLEVRSLPPNETAIGEIGWIVDSDWKEIVVSYSPQAFGDVAVIFTFHPEDIPQ